MGKKEQTENLESLKERLKRKFDELAEPMKHVDCTLENYEKLFPDNKVLTPIGEVNLGKNQFEKLKANDRENLLGAMYQTLTDPVAVIKEEDNRGEIKLFTKSFKNGEERLKGLMSVIIDRNGTKIVISTHRRKPNNIINKIKNPADLLYEKQIDGVAGYGWV